MPNEASSLIQEEMLKPDRSEILSVSQITALVKVQLESKFPRVSVTGEISNLTRQSSGHIYFTLKDRFASISCVMFRSYAARVRCDLEHGKKVIVQGAIRVYEPRGSYQINVVSISPAGLGNLHLEFERLKEEFRQKGYFDQEIKQAIPLIPRRIGIITSPTGAVIQDLRQVIDRRCSIGLELFLFPVKVQGEGSKEAIVKAIRYFNDERIVDILILARGGGSLEDLWAFNEPEVIEEIYQSKIPIISAIGHETDYTLSDFAADVRAATPSVAGELCVPNASGLREFLEQKWVGLTRRLSDRMEILRKDLAPYSKKNLNRSLNIHFERRSQDLDWIMMHLISSIKQVLESKSSRLPALMGESYSMEALLKRLIQAKADTLNHRNPRRYLRLVEEELIQYRVRLKQAELHGFQSMKDRLSFLRESLLFLKERLAQANPRQVLDKGYAIIHKAGQPIMGSDEIEVGDRLELEFHNGNIEVLVEGKRNEKRKN